MADIPITSDSRRHDRGRPFRSKLVPFSDHIARWQREGKSYKEMAKLLSEVAGVSVHPDTINSFVLVRARGGGKVAMLPESPSTLSDQAARQENAVASQTPGSPVVAHRKGPGLSAGRILGSDGKEIKNARYEPANPDDL
jgi:hypothetical protein